ncbi:MAG: LacI family DNA-binding transcriptional regulator [Spirochaetaceae bacterium]|nr:LacI family DNA-binding transcriptional regulator [Spirochaetaceae bacterium]
MATIKDVAKAAGVSLSTASYALNDSAKISTETKERIKRVAGELRYMPDGAARNLKRKKTDTIGVFLGDISGPFYGELIFGIQEVLSKKGIDMIVCCSHDGKAATAEKTLREKLVDGAIVLTPFIDDEFILSMAMTRAPIVVLDRELRGTKVYSVLIDNEKGGFLAASRLISSGFRRIYYVSGPAASYDESKRFAGYRRALFENGIVFEKSWRIEGDFTEESGFAAMKTQIERGEIPEAVFCANDEMAIGALKGLREAGIDVPGQASVVGFDDIRLSSYVTPRLTTIRRPIPEMGLLAAHVLLKAIAGENVGASVMLSVELVERESCREGSSAAVGNETVP